ncbi:MAG: hypothetical protein QOE45_2109 [Frankiaceae bacterium]|jgi:hypothetical protein|nr:hypothetical protein [Frankiaceae bacterium]
MRSRLCALALVLGAAPGWGAVPARAGELCLVVTSPAGPPAGTCVGYPFPTDCLDLVLGPGGGVVTVRICYPAP